MNMRATAIPVQETKYLRSKVDGYVYIWTKALADRDDMMPCDKIPDDFKKEQNYANPKDLLDIRFMKKDEVMDEARVVWGVSFDRTLTSQTMKVKLRALRRDGKKEDS